MRRNDTEFPAQFAGNWLSVPGFAPRDMLPVRRAPKTVKHPGGVRGDLLEDEYRRHGIEWEAVEPKVRGEEKDPGQAHCNPGDADRAGRRPGSAGPEKPGGRKDESQIERHQIGRASCRER